MNDVAPVAPPPVLPLVNLSPFIVPPDIRALLNALKTEVGAEINCHQIGQVVAFDPTKYTVTVKLVLQRAFYANPSRGTQIPVQPLVIDYPVLVDVPVFYFSGGGAYLVMPIQAGDTCLVLFNDRDLDPWVTFGASPALPNSTRMHSLADGLALVGFRSQENLPVNIPTDGQHMALGNSSGTVIAGLDAMLTALISSGVFSGGTVTALTAAKASLDAILQ